ncbi:MAG: hypothetical protein WBA31_05970, partial [Candidatus Dormiibacterota bacterium]
MTPQVVIAATAIYYTTAAIDYAVEAVVIAIMSVVGIATAFTPIAQRTATEVDEVIGGEATSLSLDSYRWKVGMWVCGLLLLVLVPLGTWAPVVRSHIMLVPAVIAGVAMVWCGWQNVRLGPKVERAASAYVGERLGYELTISQPLGFSRRRWERSVARAEQ